MVLQTNFCPSMSRSRPGAAALSLHWPPGPDRARLFSTSRQVCSTTALRANHAPGRKTGEHPPQTCGMWHGDATRPARLQGAAASDRLATASGHTREYLDLAVAFSLLKQVPDDERAIGRSPKIRRHRYVLEVNKKRTG